MKSFTNSAAPVVEPTAPMLPRHPVPKAVDADLVQILSWPRAHGSFADMRFRAWLAAHLADAAGTPVQYLAGSCMYVEVLPADGKASTTLFSCHIDTVDDMASSSSSAVVPIDKGGSAQEKLRVKTLNYDPIKGIIGLDNSSTVGTCLGADDGVGVWIMLNMIKAKVPGGYIFHTGEECGGIGSRAVLSANLQLLKKYEVAVAFDRPRCNEVITHQGGSECASDKFARALCAQLNTHGFDYKPSNGGTFTDTKVYRGVIAECTNLGVGYVSQHGRNETLDYGHAFALMEAACKLDWNSLPVDRDPTKPDPAPAYPTYKGTYGGYASSLWDERRWDDESFWDGNVKPKKTKKKAKVKAEVPDYDPMDSVFDSMLGCSMTDLECFAADEPEKAARTMMQLMAEIGRLRGECAVLQSMFGPEDL